MLLGCNTQCIACLKIGVPPANLLLRGRGNQGGSHRHQDPSEANPALRGRTFRRQRRARFLPKELEISSCLGRFDARCEEDPCLDASGFTARFEQFEGYRARGLVLTIESRSRSEQVGSECIRQAAADILAACRLIQKGIFEPMSVDVRDVAAGRALIPLGS